MGLSEEEIAEIGPYIQVYTRVIQCKNLGISLPADCIRDEDLDLIHEFYVVLEETNQKVNKRGK